MIYENIIFCYVSSRDGKIFAKIRARNRRFPILILFICHALESNPDMRSRTFLLYNWGQCLTIKIVAH